MEGYADDLGAPESWEVADLDESMRRLMVSSRKDSKSVEPAVVPASSSLASPSSSLLHDKGSEDAINQVDQFLREALQNPRERLSVLRLEQDVQKFIRDPTQRIFEFQQLPTSYLRCAAYRVAQHYSLQLVQLESNLPDSRIIVRKTSETRLPLIRLADIPANIPSDDSGVTKVAIKQRPQKQSKILGNATSNSSEGSSLKSVEARKEEYNKARARIFNSSNNSGLARKPENEPRLQDGSQHRMVEIPKLEEKSVSGVSDVYSGRGSIESSMSNSRSTRINIEEPVNRYRPNNRVAIFRDREVERKDPDYDRSYDRYTQRFDPGFGFNGGSYPIQPTYTPAVNYNTEFPQLGSSHMPQMSSEHQPRASQHLPGLWASSSTQTGIGYGHPETMMTPYTPNQIGARSTSAIYMHSYQYPIQQSGVPFVHPHEHVHQPFTQSHPQQPDTSYGLARPR